MLLDSLVYLAASSRKRFQSCSALDPIGGAGNRPSAAKAASVPVAHSAFGKLADPFRASRINIKLD